MNGKYQIEMVDERFEGQSEVAEINALMATTKNPQTCLKGIVHQFVSIVQISYFG